MKISHIFWIAIILSSVCLAQFKKKAIGIGGNFSWESTYRDYEEVTSIITIKPEINYFYRDNLSVLISLNTLINIFPKSWESPPDVDFGFAFGARYYLKYFYGGISFQFKKMSPYPSREHLLFEIGRLIKLNEKVCLDIGLDYQQGISTANKRNSKIKMEIGIAVFL